MKVPLKPWVANAEVSKRERKSRTKQNKDHKNTCGDSMENTNPTHVATAEKLLPSRNSCKWGRLRGLFLRVGIQNVIKLQGLSRSCSNLLRCGYPASPSSQNQCLLSRPLGPLSPHPPQTKQNPVTKVLHS